MYFTSGGANEWKVNNTKTVTRKCLYCGNTGEHYVLARLVGPALGFIFQPAKTKLGFRKYYLVCPICHRISKELTKNELEYLKEHYYDDE